MDSFDSSTLDLQGCVEQLCRTQYLELEALTSGRGRVLSIGEQAAILADLQTPENQPTYLDYLVELRSNYEAIAEQLGARSKNKKH